MKIGVVYHHRGTKCIVRLCVSIYTLRRHYDGPACVMNEGPIPSWLLEFLTEHGVAVVHLPDPTEPVLIRKTGLWRDMPYDRAMYLDADTVVLGPIDDFLDLVKSNEFVASWFTGWATTGGRISRRIRQWSSVSPELIEPAVRFGKAVNGGIMGWSKTSKLLEEWSKLTRLGLAAGCNRLVIDEVACQLLLPKFPHAVAHYRWNTSGRYGDPRGASVLHFHGKKHVQESIACMFWKEAYWELRATSRFKRYLSRAWGDRRLSRYLSAHSKAISLRTRMPVSQEQRNVMSVDRQSGYRPDITIVTACDMRYSKQLRENLPRWMATTGLREQSMIVFLINVSDSAPEVKFLKAFPNIVAIPWRAPWSARESALSAFVFAAAKHVQTDYWMKLDADSRPVQDKFEWPDYRNYTITAHRWGYTRVKGDPEAQRHWLNTLDDWWGGDPVFPPGLDFRSRFYHPRINSFCSIELTEFTRKVALRCGPRLPVPSQDTTTWYIASRSQERISRINMKRWVRN